MRAEIRTEAMSQEETCLRPEVLPEANMCTTGEQILWEWSLVLWAMRISHRIQLTDKGSAVCVSQAEVEAAKEQIRLFESENTPCPPAEERTQGSAESVFWVLLGLAVWYTISKQQVPAMGLDSLPWLDMGRVDSRAMLDQGQWWRCLTSLTLHSDPEHLLSNLIFGGVFLHLLCRELGGGLAWLVTILSAGVANACNVLVQGPGHLAIGASTAVFAALGLLIAGHKGQTSRKVGLIAPLGAGLALLAWLGSGGERTDVGAHVFGFGVGLIGGMAMHRMGIMNQVSRGPKKQNVLGLVALGLMVLAWVLAVRF